MIILKISSLKKLILAPAIAIKASLSNLSNYLCKL